MARINQGDVIVLTNFGKATYFPNGVFSLKRKNKQGNLAKALSDLCASSDSKITALLQINDEETIIVTDDR